MTLTSRDKKVLALLAIIGLVAGYWYLIFKPKQAEIGSLGSKVAAQERSLKDAEQRLALSTAARASYATDYTKVVRLGKAVPDDDAIASLLVQLDALAGAKVDFTQIGIQAYPQPLLQASTNGGGDKQGDGAGGSSTAVPAAAGSGSSANTSSSPSSSGNGAGPAGAAKSQDQSSGLGFQPVEVRLQFEGNFFRLHKLFAAIDHLVKVSGGRGIVINGRLVFVEGFGVKAGRPGFPTVAINIGAYVFSLPKGESVTGGATPQAPAQGGSQPVSQPGGSQPASATPPATATPAKP